MFQFNDEFAIVPHGAREAAASLPFFTWLPQSHQNVFMHAHRYIKVDQALKLRGLEIRRVTSETNGVILVTPLPLI